MEMFGDDGKSLGTLQVQEKLSEWKDGEPVRKMVSIGNEEYAGNTIYYGTNEAGVWALSGATVAVTVNLLFQDVRTISQYKFSGCLPRINQKM